MFLIFRFLRLTLPLIIIIIHSTLDFNIFRNICSERNQNCGNPFWNGSLYVDVHTNVISTICRRERRWGDGKWNFPSAVSLCVDEKCSGREAPRSTCLLNSVLSFARLLRVLATWPLSRVKTTGGWHEKPRWNYFSEMICHWGIIFFLTLLHSKPFAFFSKVFIFFTATLFFHHLSWMRKLLALTMPVNMCRVKKEKERDIEACCDGSRRKSESLSSANAFWETKKK